MRRGLAVPVATSIGVPRWRSYEVEDWGAVKPWGLLGVTDPEEFAARYVARLNARERRVLRELAELRERYAGWPIALLCWEKPGEFCHRVLLGEWISERTGEVISELS